MISFHARQAFAKAFLSCEHIRIQLYEVATMTALPDARFSNHIRRACQDRAGYAAQDLVERDIDSVEQCSNLCVGTFVEGLAFPQAGAIKVQGNALFARPGDYLGQCFPGWQLATYF